MSSSAFSSSKVSLLNLPSADPTITRKAAGRFERAEYDATAGQSGRDEADQTSADPIARQAKRPQLAAFSSRFQHPAIAAPKMFAIRTEASLKDPRQIPRAARAAPG